MKLSVFSATFNRAELLDNALYTYSKQTLPFDEWEYLIADDGSQDHTKDVIGKWIKKGLPLRYFSVSEDLGAPKEPGKWRDGSRPRNAVSTHAFGEVIVGTHPEIMIPPDALEVMYQMVMTYPEDYWITAIPYWLPAGSMASWKKDLHNLRETEGFYDPSWPDPVHSPGAIDYRNQNQERRETWESEVFWGMRMRLWRWMGGFREFEQWGSVDMDFLHRRGALKIPTIIAKSKDSPHEKNYLMVYHQNHESVRDMEKALEGIKGTVYPNEESARKAGGLYPIYNHGHRERATDGALGGILGDHIARYRWASFFTPGKIVVDIPCGTGYGSTFHRSVKAYYGMDIDAESIETADDFYGDDKHFFEVAGMTDIPLDDNSANIILCFEGLEHISYGDQVAFMLEMRRVLKPGGSFIISTPQHGAAPGTPWDRYMLDQPGLEALFTNPDYPWKKLDWFYQMSYGRDENPFMGRPPKDAQIMILGGSVVK